MAASALTALLCQKLLTVFLDKQWCKTVLLTIISTHKVTVRNMKYLLINND